MQERETAPRETTASNGAVSGTLPRRRRIFFRIILLLLVAVGAFALIETAFRVKRHLEEARLGVRAERGETWAVFDEELGYRLREQPNRPLGLRTPPIGKKDESRTRVLILGDSIPHGGDSEDDTLVAYAQKALTGGGFASELINAGIPGYTTFQELGFLKKYGVLLEPDVVGISFCVNDLHKVLQEFRVRDGKIIGNAFDTAESAAAQSHGTLYMLARKSLFLRWVRHRAGDLAKRWDIDVSTGFSFDRRSDLATAWQDEPWSDFELWLSEMVDLGRSHNFTVFVVAFPFADQYREQYLQRDRTYVLKPQSRLRALCNRLELPMLNLYDSLQVASDFQGDGIHLTKTGRKKVGKLLAEFLIDEEIVHRTDITEQSGG